MKNNKLLLTASLFSLFALGACDAGDNQKWEAKLFKGVPYTDERTAGTGFKWVLVAMAPRKGVVLDPIMDEAANSVPPAVKVTEYAPMTYDDAEEKTQINDAEPIFNNKMMK